MKNRLLRYQKDTNPSLLPRNEKEALDILEKAVTKVDGYCSLGLLWRGEFPYFPNNKSLSLHHFLSLEKKFKNNPEFHTKFQKTIKEYIEKENAKKI